MRKLSKVVYIYIQNSHCRSSEQGRPVGTAVPWDMGDDHLYGRDKQEDLPGKEMWV